MDLLTTAEAAEFVKLPSDAKGINRFRVWACRHAVPRVYRGRTPLWERRVLEAFLHRKAWTKRHREPDDSAA
jgi:hypothetical protein